MKQEQQQTQAQKAVPEEQHLAHHSGTRRAQTGQHEPTLSSKQRCANCDIDFFWSPTVVQNKLYCCTGCAAGGPCNCDYSLYRSVTVMGIIHYE